MAALATAAAVLLCWNPLARAAETSCDGRWFAGVQGLYVDLDDRVSDRETGAGGRLGLGRRNCAAISGQSHWELNLDWNTIDDTGQDGDRQLGLMLHRLRFYGERWQPYWQAGVGAQQERLLADDHTRPALEFGVGLLRRLGAGGFAVRLDLAVRGTYEDDAPSGDKIRHDGRVALGLLLPLTSRVIAP